MRQRPVNKRLEWLEANKPIIHNGVKCIPVSVARITTDDYKITLTSEHIADGIPFQIITKLNDLIQDKT